MAECVEIQVSEVDLLLSMYPDEVEFDDPLALDIARQFCEDPSDDLLPSLSFYVKLNCGEESEVHRMKLHCRFLKSYPLETAADFHLSCDNFSRESQRRVNEELKNYADSLIGECMVVALIQWIQEKAHEYIVKTLCDDNAASATVREVEDERSGVSSFHRIWLYMHHIYSKRKRKDILDWSHELVLTGFCLPGKPGVVCVEGDARNVDEFWRRIRSMTWQRMSCKHREELLGVADDLRCFTEVKEMNFDAHGGRHNHMDLGLFFQYLDKHGHADKFEMLFGVEGRLGKSAE
ncbi:RWD domain-containing protein 2B-like [Sycon ciliatum]|uniref:RWD domain-containing protein 2B-like n=1 Tax=Sycon ciliatum TaxID=27933 RepID=UPI0020AD043A